MNCYKAIVLASVSVVAACASKNSAPVVYGTQPSSTARIYTSPDEILSEQREASIQRQQAYASNNWARQAELPPVSPVAATRDDVELRRQRYDYNSKPIYIAKSDPVSLGGTVERHPLSGAVIVEPGDTVYGIARKTNSSPKDIIALNALRSPYALSPGQRLRVPASSIDRSQQIAATPVRKVSNIAVRNDTTYLVRPGDTLYSISRRTGTTVAALANANRLTPPYALSVGQSLRVPEISLDGAIYREPSDVELPKAVAYEKPVTRSSSRFVWPIKGAIVDRYGSTGSGKRNDGVNIAAPVGAPVRAAADGEVVYRGSELDGYGNLLLVKHEDGFVTAYAHNDVMLVRKGQKVRQGQVISKVGQSGSAKQPQLHFEIRQNLKAIDPIGLLGS